MPVDLSPEQEAAIVQSILENKPYLLKIEDTVQSLQYGEINIVLSVRGGVVNKMDFPKAVETWVKNKGAEKSVDIDRIQKTDRV